MKIFRLLSTIFMSSMMNCYRDECAVQSAAFLRTF